jgi:hypothetical protein
MALLPPVGGADMATKKDLEATKNAILWRVLVMLVGLFGAQAAYIVPVLVLVR